jgi:hypothetical protein
MSFLSQTSIIGFRPCPHLLSAVEVLLHLASEAPQEDFPQVLQRVVSYPTVLLPHPLLTEVPLLQALALTRVDLERRPGQTALLLR